MPTNPKKVEGLTVKILVDLSEDTPVYYANYAEVTLGQFDCGISFVRVPVKMPENTMAGVKETGKIILPADVHIVVPTNIIPGLLSALQTQMNELEKRGHET